MKLLNKRELKIFFTFFIIYSFFIHWVGWNENSRLALIRAIVDEGRFEIDSYANQTTDRAFFNEHYYSDKDPGLSLVAMPIYAIWKFIYNSFLLRLGMNEGSKEYTSTLVGVSNVPIVEYVNPGFFILTSMVVIIIFTSSLFSSLTVLLIYKLTGYFMKKEVDRLLLITIFGLGSLAFPYATVFVEQMPAAFFSFLTFYLLFKMKKEKIKDDKIPLLAGISSGFVMSISVISAIITLGNLVYLLTIDRSKIKLFIIPELLGMLPFFIYNYTIFGTPFTLSRYYLDPKIWPKLPGINGLQLPNPFVVLRVTFYPEKGLFFYYPILLLSIANLFYFYKRLKIESILCIFIFLAFLIVNSCWWVWWGGAYFGPRHLSLAIPFLVLPLLTFFEKIRGKKLLRYFTYFLIGISIFHNFISFEPIKEPISLVTLNLTPFYKDKMNSLLILENPIYKYHFPSFIKHGPRSRVFECLINLKIPDIRDIPLSLGRFFPFVGGYYNPYLFLLLLSIIIIFIWRNETLKRKTINIFIHKVKEDFIYIMKIIRLISKHKNKIILVVFFLLLGVFIKSVIEAQTKLIEFVSNWYDAVPEENVRWMQQNGTISLYNPTNKTEKFQLQFYIKSFYKDRDITIYLNDKKIDNFIAFKEGEFITTPLLELNPGKNILKLYSSQGCDVPYSVTGLEDFRCLSVGVNDLKFKPIREDEIVFSQNWYIGEERWMQQNGTIYIYNSAEEPKEIKLKFYSQSLHKDRLINLILNDKLVDTFIVFKEGSLIFTRLLKLNPGENILKFHSLENCSSPSEVIGNNDKRCLSIKIENFSIIPLDYIIKERWDKTFDKNWYNKEEHEDVRWMQQNGTISLHNFNNSLKNVKEILIYLRAFYKNRTVDVYLNDKLIGIYNIPSAVYGEILFQVPSLPAGENILLLHSREGCDVVHSVEKWEDYRCLSIGIDRMYLVVK
jgi:hypothetical protein